MEGGGIMKKIYTLEFVDGSSIDIYDKTVITGIVSYMIKDDFYSKVVYEDNWNGDYKCPRTLSTYDIHVGVMGFYNSIDMFFIQNDEYNRKAFKSSAIKSIQF